MRTVSALVLLAAAASQRSVVMFDLGWRTSFGSYPGYAGQCASVYANLSAVQCNGLTQVQATDATSCAAAGCALGAAVWQWASSQGCWVGGATDTFQCSPNAAWVGGEAAVPPAALVAYNDSAWE